MPWKIEDRQYFLDRAEELRTIAGNCRLAENHKMLLNMAGYYERFAREVEERIWERDRKPALERNQALARIFGTSDAEEADQPHDHLRAVERENGLDIPGILTR